MDIAAVRGKNEAPKSSLLMVVAEEMMERWAGLSLDKLMLMRALPGHLQVFLGPLVFLQCDYVKRV
jgi:hypothetical protein